MKKFISLLMLCVLLVAMATGHASSSLGAVFENEGAETSGGLGEKFEQTGDDTQPGEHTMTAQQWIDGFLTGAEEQGLAADVNFHLVPATVPGRDCYEMVIAKTPDYMIGVALFYEGGVGIKTCSLRMASGMLRSDDLVKANDIARRAIRTMAEISVPATQEEFAELWDTLNPDIPAALLRGQSIDMKHMVHGVTLSLSAVQESDAYFDSTGSWTDGYIVDFMIQADEPLEAG